MMKKLVCAFFMMAATMSVQAQSDDLNDYFTIGSVQTIDVTDNKGEDFSLPPISVKDGYVPYLSEVIMIVDKLIALGEKIYTIVEKGKPVVVTDFPPSFSILPLVEDQQYFADTFHEMENWSAPKTKLYETIYKNLYGAKVVRFKFAIHFQYDGALNGVGRYLTGVTVTPVNVDVAWGYTFNAKVFLDSVTNRGSSEFPVAGATLGLAYTVKTILKQSDVVLKYHIDGRGGVLEMQ